MKAPGNECLEPSEAGRGKKGFSPRALAGNMVLRVCLPLCDPLDRSPPGKNTGVGPTGT